MVVNQTNPAIFDCSATGVPTPLIQWYRLDLLLNGTGLGINLRVNLTNTVNVSLGEVSTVVSTLSIRDTLGDDSGAYTCVASSVLSNYTDIVEERDEESVELFVQGKQTIHTPVLV